MISHAISMALLVFISGSTVAPGEIGIATKGYVDMRVSQISQDVDRNRSKLDTILELNLAAEIDKLLRFKCMAPGDTSRDDTLRRYEREYRELTGVAYERPDCAYLVESQ